MLRRQRLLTLTYFASELVLFQSVVTTQVTFQILYALDFLFKAMTGVFPVAVLSETEFTPFVFVALFWTGLRIAFV